MAKKLFDSPYGKGVALNFKIDQAPYRQMIKDNKAEAKAREAARKEKEQDLNNILKSITYDDKNVIERHRPNARAEYAATIDDIIKHNKSQDLASLYKRIGDFNSTMRTYGDEKLAFDSYVKAASGGKHWASQDYIADVNNTEISDEDIVDRHSDVMQYNKESGTFSEVATNKKDPLAFVNQAMQGMSPMFYRGDDGKLKSTGRLSETGDYLFLQSKAEDPETFYNELAGTWIQDPENVIHTQNALGLTAEEYMEAPIKHARELLDPIASAKMFSEVAKKEATQPRPDKDPPETSTSIQLSGGDTSLTVQSQKASSEMRDEAIDKAFSSLPTEEEDGVESTDYSLQGFKGSAVQRRLEAMGFETKTEDIPFPGITDNLYVTKGDKKAKYDLDENVYTNLRSFVDENAGDVLEDNPLEIINLPRDAQHVISQTKATEAQNKINLLPIKNAIVVGADGMDYMALTNNIDLRGQVSEVYDYLDINFDNIDKLKGGEEGDPGYSFYDAAAKDNIKEGQNGRKRYYKIIPGGSIEGGTSTDREFNDVIGKQTGKGTGYEASRTGAIEYILVEETPELKSRFESNYKLNPDALNPFDNEQ